MVQPADPEEKALNADQLATGTQAGIEKALIDELTKGLNYAGRSLAALDE